MIAGRKTPGLHAPLRQSLKVIRLFTVFSKIISLNLEVLPSDDDWDDEDGLLPKTTKAFQDRQVGTKSSR
jgi:hypothetical protein